MNSNPQFNKQCSRCPLVVRLTREQFEKEKDQAETTCPRCRDILTAEVAEILRNGAPLPADASPAPSSTSFY